MGNNRFKRRKIRKQRTAVKTQQLLISALCARPHKWTTIKNLAAAVGVKISTAGVLLEALVKRGDVALQPCSSWEGSRRYRVLPGRWPTDAQLRELIIADAAALGMTKVLVAQLSNNLSQRLLGFTAPEAVNRVIFDMLNEGELICPPDTVSYSRCFVSVPVNTWLKRTAKEQARAGMVFNG